MAVEIGTSSSGRTIQIHQDIDVHKVINELLRHTDIELFDALMMIEYLLVKTKRRGIPDFIWYEADGSRNHVSICRKRLWQTTSLSKLSLKIHRNPINFMSIV